MSFTVLSLFDGISCGRDALKKAGVPVKQYFASEIDPNCIKVSLTNYPDIIQLGDIRFLNGKDLPKIDLLIGGSPCLGFSSSGKGLNFNDPRSALFFEYVRVLKETKPKYFLLENVKMKKEWADIISNYIGVEPILINSSDFSAQNRPRLYWTNISILPYMPKRITFGDIRQRGLPEKDTAYYTEKGLNWLKKHGERKNKTLRIFDDYTIVPCLTASHCKGYSSKRFFGIPDIFGLRYLTVIEMERLQTLPDGYTRGLKKTAAMRAIGNGWTVDVIDHILRGIN